MSLPFSSLNFVWQLNDCSVFYTKIYTRVKKQTLYVTYKQLLVCVSNSSTAACGKYVLLSLFDWKKKYSTICLWQMLKHGATPRIVWFLFCNYYYCCCCLIDIMHVFYICIFFLVNQTCYNWHSKLQVFYFTLCYYYYYLRIENRLVCCLLIGLFTVFFYVWYLVCLIFLNS